MRYDVIGWSGGPSRPGSRSQDWWVARQGPPARPPDNCGSAGLDAVAVANTNECGYCLAVHTGLGRKTGLSTEELSAAQIGESTDAKTAAQLGFVLSVIEKRGHIDRTEVDVLREYGWSNEQIAEALGQVVLNVFTNYVHAALDVPNPFPPVPFKAA